MPVDESRPRGLRWVLGLTALSFFMVVLDSLVVVTALPRMQQVLHVGLATLQWTVNAYGIAFAAGVITAAALGDRFGRRRVFVCGLALFTVASAACALAPDASLLIVARTVQGLGGAAVLPLSLTILTGAFPVERRGTVVGIYGGLAGLAVASGPLVGGALTQGLDWHWIFWANVPLGIVAAALSLRMLPETRGGAARFDLPGVVLLSAAAVGFVWGLVRAGSVGWSSSEVALSLSGSIIFLASFLLWEGRLAEPLLPLRLLRNTAFVAGNTVGFLMNGAIFAGALLVTQYFQTGLGYSPLAAGVRLLPLTLTPLFIAPLAGALSDRVGRRPVIATGLTVQAIGFGWVAIVASSRSAYPELAVALLVTGAGVSMALPAVPAAVLSAVDPHQLGKASGISNMMQRFGSVFAVAIASTIFTSYSHGSSNGIAAGFRPAIAVCSLLAFLGALAALMLRDRRQPASRTGSVPVAA
jgi:EmrB/QacA subfamily drug resistance transporter